MSRILLYSGKGGVGKTTIAAASGLELAKRGHRTLIISFDLAHSLADAFDVEQALFEQKQGKPHSVRQNLDIQEVNVQAETKRHWSDIHEYFRLLFSSAETSKLLAEELTFIPGIENIICLLYINEYVQEGTYDMIVVDCPPTADSIRFVSLPRAIEWYLEKRFKLDRLAMQIARPFIKMTDYGVMPEDQVFETLKKMFLRVQGMETILADPETTSVRLVTNAEKLIVKETQRAFLYFSLYGVNTDAVIVNRLFPESEGYFNEWAKTQYAHAKEIEGYFQPIPVFKLPLFSHELEGVSGLEELAAELFKDSDPAAHNNPAPPFGFDKQDEKYILKLPLPFAETHEVNITPRDSDIVISVGSFERFVPLPNAVIGLPVESAVLKNHELTVIFSPAETQETSD